MPDEPEKVDIHFETVPVTFVYNAQSGRVLVDVQELDAYLVALRGSVDPHWINPVTEMLTMLHTWLANQRKAALRAASESRDHIT